MIVNGPIARFLTGDGTGGGGTGGTPPAAPVDIFAGIELDDLPTDQRAILEAAKTQVATLQTNAANFEKQAKIKQSEADKLAAENAKLKGQIPQNHPPQPKAPLEEMVELLMGDGMSEELARKQAPTFVRMMAATQQKVEANIANVMAPFVNNTLGQQAQASLNVMAANDPLNAFAVPEVKASVLASCEAIVQQGGNVTPEVVDNLRAMAFVKHLQSGGQPAAAPTAPVATLQPKGLTLNTGGAPFSFSAAPPPPPNPNAPRTTLGVGETAALTNIMSLWLPGKTPKLH